MSLIQGTGVPLDSLQQTAQATQQTVQLASEESLSLIQLLMKGGWIMLPILFLFFILSNQADCSIVF